VRHCYVCQLPTGIRSVIITASRPFPGKWEQQVSTRVVGRENFVFLEAKKWSSTALKFCIVCFFLTSVMKFPFVVIMYQTHLHQSTFIFERRIPKSSSFVKESMFICRSLPNLFWRVLMSSTEKYWWGYRALTFDFFKGWKELKNPLFLKDSLKASESLLSTFCKCSRTVKLFGDFFLGGWVHRSLLSSVLSVPCHTFIFFKNSIQHSVSDFLLWNLWDLVITLGSSGFVVLFCFLGGLRLDRFVTFRVVYVTLKLQVTLSGL